MCQSNSTQIDHLWYNSYVSTYFINWPNQLFNKCQVAENRIINAQFHATRTKLSIMNGATGQYLMQMWMFMSQDCVAVISTECRAQMTSVFTIT